ncbi:related to protein transport protein Sec39 [Fusarium torulosum]|uniref:Related to protein transport protein Sec39 n=1 Tax=Fusarium torulosum TaxID=33205 RepID=A0AAE8SLN2_9HYPO|nr:related to protein transport protein Sec39 [Fusarium torulosum]
MADHVPVSLGPAKLVLLAVHFATIADIDSLTYIISHHASILRPELALRILLTYLPETLSPSVYVPLVQAIVTDESPLQTNSDHQIDSSPVDSFSHEQASRKVKKLHLLPLKITDGHFAHDADPLTSFLLLRACRMDEEAGMLPQVPELLSPFLQLSPELHTWMVSTVIPLIRRNYEYYPQRPVRFSLLEFQNLPDRIAIDYLLAETGVVEEELDLAGRDLGGLVGPWLHNDSRWKREVFKEDISSDSGASELSCPGWEQALEWLVSRASTSWRVALKAVESWDGPSDIDLGIDTGSWLQETQQQYLDRSYARAVLASAYLIPEADVDALEGAFRICNKIRSLLDEDSDTTLQSAVQNLAPVSPFDMDSFGGIKAATYLRNDLLQNSNPFTTPKEESLDLLPALIQSAYLLTNSGVPCTVRRAGDLALIRDQQEQKSQLGRLIRNLPTRASDDDDFWIRARKEILWLYNWGNEPSSTGDETFQGIFGNVTLEFIETELLKALLSRSRYILARTLYDQEGPDAPLSASALINTIQNSALGAFDNASNPNRTRGGLKKCDEIIKAFPKTMTHTHPIGQRIEALLRATHALSDYRLVLKQGEPFSPVVLRVHSDPVSIIEKVLEQNPKAYTRLQEFAELGSNMVNANLPTCGRPGKQSPTSDDQDAARSMVEKRIVSMCVEAALREDDFETAYSYVVSRLGVDERLRKIQSSRNYDEWSWKAALDAGKYVRTERSQKPTHLGTASGNPEIRHLEQRIECLATSLRIAPPSQLQEVLKTFRRCEEQLDAAIKEEAAREAAWDAAGDFSGVPGSFDSPDPDKAYPPRNMTASATARQAEEAPMSLFDLSRATARVASKNLTVLSNLQGSLQGSFTSVKTNPESESSESELHEQNRTRKRDQLREAATGTLVSGVGWLLGANPNRSG